MATRQETTEEPQPALEPEPQPEPEPTPQVELPPPAPEPEPEPPPKQSRHPLVVAFRSYVGDQPEAEEWARSVWLLIADHARFSSAMPPGLAAVLLQVAAELEEEG